MSIRDGNSKVQEYTRFLDQISEYRQPRQLTEPVEQPQNQSAAKNVTGNKSVVSMSSPKIKLKDSKLTIPNPMDTSKPNSKAHQSALLQGGQQIVNQSGNSPVKAIRPTLIPFRPPEAVLGANGSISLEDFENLMNALKKEVIEEATTNQVSKPIQFLRNRIDNYDGHIEEYADEGQVMNLKLQSLNQMLKDYEQERTQYQNQDQTTGVSEPTKIQDLLKYYYENDPRQYYQLVDTYSSKLHEQIFENMGLGKKTQTQQPVRFTTNTNEIMDSNRQLLGSQMLGSQMLGSQMLGSQMLGSQMLGSQMLGRNMRESIMLGSISPQKMLGSNRYQQDQLFSSQVKGLQREATFIGRDDNGRVNLTYRDRDMRGSMVQSIARAPNRQESMIASMVSPTTKLKGVRSRQDTQTMLDKLGYCLIEV